MSSDWNDAKWLARGVLRDRKTRRRWIARMLVAPLALMAGGLWVVDGWLAGDVLRFALWWGVCALATLVVLLFALYDALAVIREERERTR